MTLIEACNEILKDIQDKRGMTYGPNIVEDMKQMFFFGAGGVFGAVTSPIMTTESDLDAAKILVVFMDILQRHEAVQKDLQALMATLEINK